MAQIKIDKMDAMLWLKYAMEHRVKILEEPDQWKREVMLTAVDRLEVKLRKVAEDGEGKGDESDGK